MAPTYKDYYKILGVDKKADEKTIKAAYRKLAGRYQTEANQGNASAEDKLKAVNEAKEILTDKSKREKYDRFGSQWKAASEGGGSGGFPGGAGGFGGDPGAGGYRVRYSTGGEQGLPPDLDDLFATLFGGGPNFGGGSRASERFNSPFSNQQRMQRQEAESSVNVTLDEAFTGATRALQVTLPGRYDMDNNRQENVTRRIEVKIPAGVEDGQKIRLAGQGIEGGDLILTIRVQAHGTFTRQGDDLHVEVAVPYYRAALGGSVSVPTLRGNRLTVTLPTGAQSGQSLRLAAQGMPRLKSGGGSGDLYARIKVTVPKTPGERERELLTEIATLAEAALSASE